MRCRDVLAFRARKSRDKNIVALRPPCMRLVSLKLIAVASWFEVTLSFKRTQIELIL
jgi:hypothetical protein